jgi:hypothetical protein
MTVQTVTAEHTEPESDDEHGVEPVTGAELRLGDVIDYPHGPAAVTGLWSPGYLTYALGPGSVVIKHAGRASRAVAGDEIVPVLLPRPAEVA